MLVVLDGDPLKKAVDGSGGYHYFHHTSTRVLKMKTGAVRRVRPDERTDAIFLRSAQINAPYCTRVRPYYCFGWRLRFLIVAFWVVSTILCSTLREGPFSQGAFWAVCGSGVPRYDFLNLNGIFGK